MSEEFTLAEAQRVMLALVGVDVDGLAETVFQFGAFGGVVDLGGVASMLREIEGDPYRESCTQRFRVFTRRGHEIGTMVLVVQDTDSVYDHEQEARVSRVRIGVGAAMCRRNGKPTPGSAWPGELRGWSSKDVYNNITRCERWMRRANQSKDRIVFQRQYLPQMIAALDAAAEEAR